jgi:hypothetical protein
MVPLCCCRGTECLPTSTTHSCLARDKRNDDRTRYRGRPPKATEQSSSPVGSTPRGVPFAARATARRPSHHPRRAAATAAFARTPYSGHWRSNDPSGARSRLGGRCPGLGRSASRVSSVSDGRECGLGASFEPFESDLRREARGHPIALVPFIQDVSVPGNCAQAELSAAPTSGLPAKFSLRPRKSFA